MTVPEVHSGKTCTHQLPPLSLREVSVTEYQWYLDASSFIEDNCYLPAAKGAEVVFVLAGYLDHCAKVRIHPTAEWTSFEQRCRQSMDHNTSKALHLRLGPSNPGSVERCKITGLSYHRRIVPSTEDAQPCLDHRENPGGSDGATHHPPSRGDAANGTESAGSNSSSHDNEDGGSDDGSDDDEDEPLAQMFVRLTLQRLPRMNERGGPLSMTIDHYIDGGASEWLVPRKRFERSAHRPWQRGDRIKMFWQDKNANGGGQWWRGVVAGAVRRGETPWAGVRVRWDDVDEEDYVSPWELQRSLREEDSGGNSGSEAGDAAATADFADEFDTDDEDWRTAGDDEPWGEGKGSKRRRHRRQSSDQGERLQKQRRLNSASKQLPPTMRVHCNGKIDWNRGHCAICMSPPEGEEVVECDGSCTRSFHLQCLPLDSRPADGEASSNWYCQDCRAGVAECACCKVKGVVGQEILKCRHGGCGQHFHPHCLRTLAQTVFLKIHSDKEGAKGPDTQPTLVFSCPYHFCARCHLSGDALRLFHCWKCVLAVHSKCLDQMEVRLNAKEMECRDCIAGQSQRARSRDDQKAAEPRRDWLASLTDVKTGKKVDLVGKEIFHFGAHTKGGGCDFIIPLEALKFHSQIRVLPDGSATLSYCHRGSKITELDVRRAEKKCVVSKTTPLPLENWDIIIIADHVFRYNAIHRCEAEETPLP